MANYRVSTNKNNNSNRTKQTTERKKNRKMDQLRLFTLSCALLNYLYIYKLQKHMRLKASGWRANSAWYMFKAGT
jgi:hypothetical protein